MRLKKIYELADGIAPFALSKEYCEKYGFRDNSGIQLDCGNEITSVLFSLDLSLAVVDYAKKIGADCIFTHHPAIFNPLISLDAEGRGREIVECAKAGISVISAHLNLDAAEGGIDDYLMQGLGGKSALETMHALTGGGYGKIFTVEEQPVKEFVEQAEMRFHTNKTIVYGKRPVHRVASFCGAGTDDDTVAFALKHGADTFVSSDGKHHCIAALAEHGVNVILLTHYAAEFYGFTRFYEKFQILLKGTDVVSELIADERFL
jgi:dinuclear metal center YbgI/SA1388 family protein